MGFSLIPRETRFYGLFNEAASHLRTAAHELHAMVRSFDNLDERARALKEEEEACDGIIRKTIETLNRCFITPFDREDIHSLVTSMDDVMDRMEETAHRFSVFRVERLTPEAVELARIVQEACTHLEEAIGQLHDLRESDRIKDHLRAISRLENEADRVYRQADAKLFVNADGEIARLIQWRELYARLEDTVDATKQVAHVIAGIVIKGT